MWIEIFLMVLLAGLSAVLCLTGIISWKRTGSLKIGLVAVALFIFMIKGIYMSYYGIAGGVSLEPAELLLMDVLVVGMLYFSVLK